MNSEPTSQIEPAPRSSFSLSRSAILGFLFGADYVLFMNFTTYTNSINADKVRVDSLVFALCNGLAMSFVFLFWEALRYRNKDSKSGYYLVWGLLFPLSLIAGYIVALSFLAYLRTNYDIGDFQYEWFMGVIFSVIAFPAFSIAGFFFEYCWRQVRKHDIETPILIFLTIGFILIIVIDLIS